jgi:hypothetical protein
MPKKGWIFSLIVIKVNLIIGWWKIGFKINKRVDWCDLIELNLIYNLIKI